MVTRILCIPVSLCIRRLVLFGMSGPRGILVHPAGRPVSYRPMAQRKKEKMCRARNPLTVATG